MVDKKVTLEEYIYEEIKKAIFSRKIGPNAVLSEEQLAEAFSVSRTPVRHVLKRMHYEKFVEIKPKKGVTIYEPTVKEMEEVFLIKKILEKEALKDAAEKVSAEQLQMLEQMTYEEEEFYKQGSYYEALLKGNQFHIEIIKLCGNDLLLRYYKELTDLTNLYLAFYDHVPDDPIGPSEHRKIIEAISRKDKKQIEKEVVHHWDRVKEFMVYNSEKNTTVDLKAIFKPMKEQ